VRSVAKSQLVSEGIVEFKTTNVNTLLSKFLCQTLCKGSEPMFSGCKRTGGGIATDTGSSPCKKEGSPLSRTTLPAFPQVLKTEFQKLGNNLAGEGKGSGDVDIERITEIAIGDIQKRLPNTMTCVEKRDTERRGGGRKMSPYGCKCRTNGVGGVICDWECSGLEGDVSKNIKIVGTKVYLSTTLPKLFRKFVERFLPSRDQGDPVASLSKETPR